MAVAISNCVNVTMGAVKFVNVRSAVVKRNCVMAVVVTVIVGRVANRFGVDRSGTAVCQSVPKTGAVGQRNERKHDSLCATTGD